MSPHDLALAFWSVRYILLTLAAMFIAANVAHTPWVARDWRDERGQR